MVWLRRFALLGVASGALWASATGTSSASLFLVFDRTSGAPGAVVNVRTGGSAGCTECPPRIELYFVEATAADRTTSPDDPGLERAGELFVGSDGNGHGRLTIPDVPNGDYTVIAHCDECAPTSGGRAMLPVGPFDAPFSVIGSSIGASHPVWTWFVALAVVSGILTLVLLLWPRRHHPHPPESSS
jgi:hypothetical protein